ncbi:MAG: sigma-70 family RNA polymerase sigma factor [Spirochaetota bacterium]|nr:sigma-70 family RNA polymerase sigma factor [Spirochaetota bacterium]
MATKKDKFTEDHKRYYPVVFSTVYTKIGNIDDASDICQEIFIKFFEKYEEIQNSRKWLYGALRIAILEFFRRTRAEEVNIDDVFGDVGLTFVNGFKDSRVIISEAIDNMDNFGDEGEKTLFDLIAVYNYSYSEAAKQMGLTKRKAEYRYRRIVDRIIDYLNKKGIKDIEDLL